MMREQLDFVRLPFSKNILRKHLIIVTINMNECPSKLSLSLDRSDRTTAGQGRSPRAVGWRKKKKKLPTENLTVLRGTFRKGNEAEVRDGSLKDERGQRVVWIVVNVVRIVRSGERSPNKSNGRKRKKSFHDSTS